MELIIFLVFLALSLILIILGSATSSPLLGIVGFTLLFLLGLVILNDDLTYKSGELTTEVYIYGNNYSGYHWDYTGTEPALIPPDLNDPDFIKLFHRNVTNANVYSSLDATENHIYGYLMAILGALGFVLLLFELPQSLKDTYKRVKEDLHT